jgi:hypothetical protein
MTKSTVNFQQWEFDNEVSISYSREPNSSERADFVILERLNFRG